MRVYEANWSFPKPMNFNLKIAFLKLLSSSGDDILEWHLFIDMEMKLRDQGQVRLNC
jgi:hypothetical protein